MLALCAGMICGAYSRVVAGPADTLTYASNGYTYPGGVVRIFFLPRSGGDVQVSPLGGRPGLTMRLDSGTALTDGHFTVTGGRYHFIEVSGPVDALVFTGPGTTGMLYNKSEYRGAAATHLSYPMPKDSAAEWFYSEISVPAGAEPYNAYYMVDGFADGYFGIQVNGPKERHILFSIWSSYSTNDPKDIPADYAVTLVKKGADVTTNAFGNEGSGGQSYWNYMWKPETAYRLLVRAQAKGGHTLFSAWFYAPERHAWKFLAMWDKAKSGGRQLSHLYSFVENFGDNGNDFFKARYGNQWMRTPAGTWIELTDARFTTTANPGKHQRYDWGGGVEGGWFYQFSGGFREVGDLKYGDTIHRPAGGKAPDVDLEALPEQ